MISYIPFLKAKLGELNAMSELAPKVKQAICPFFDFPRSNKEYDSTTYASVTHKIAKCLKKHWGTDAEFYFDDLDIGQKLELDGEEKYAYMLRALHELCAIPVVGLSRTTHNASVGQLKRVGEIDSATVAFRVEKTDFEDFDVVEDQIENDLKDIFDEFAKIDLILDCRFCTALDVLETGQEIAAFVKKFCAAYSVRRVIVAGSSIPRSIRDILEVNCTKTVSRHELAIIVKARELSAGNIIAGDYASVSPFYAESNIDPLLMQTVMTPRLIYPFKHSHFVYRGYSMKAGGYEQYVGLTKALCGQGFFRSGNSTGEDYFYEKSQGIGKKATNATVVKPSVVAHITYMVLDVKL